MDDVLQRSGSAIARAIAAGETTSADAVEAHIESIQAVNPRINAVVADRFDAAREEARAADAQVAAGSHLPPLHGVPCTIKESIHLEGMPNAAGVVARRDERAASDGVTVAPSCRRRHPSGGDQHVGADPVDRVGEPALRPDPQRV